MTNQPGGMAPAGFYPAENGRIRYWDGSQWTSLYRDQAPSAAGPVPSSGGSPTSTGGPGIYWQADGTPRANGGHAQSQPVPDAGRLTTGPQDRPAVAGQPTMVLGGPPVLGPPDQRTWFARHKVLTGIVAVVLLLLVISIASASSGTKVQTVAGPAAASPAPAPSSASSSTTTSGAAGKAAADKAAADKAAADKAAADKAAADKAAADKAAADKAAADKAAADKAAAGTVSQQNAVRKADSYLGFTAFSRSELIHQLEFDGFSTADATYGVDKQNADWNEQAAKKAKSYLAFTSFSHSSLLAQLKFDGFTAQQAEYGVAQTGL